MCIREGIYSMVCKFYNSLVTAMFWLLYDMTEAVQVVLGARSRW